MSGIDDLASTVVQESQAAAVYRRIWIVSAVNAGPPVTVNLKQTAAGATGTRTGVYAASPAYHGAATVVVRGAPL